MATSSARNVWGISFHQKTVLESMKRRLWKSNHRGQATIVKYQTSIDEEAKQQLEQKVLKHKTHPGVVNTKTVRLPTVLEEGVKKVLQDHHVKQLQPHAKTMAQYLWSRKRPVEEADMRKRAREFAEELGVGNIDEELYGSGDIPAESKVKISQVMQTLKSKIYKWKPIRYDEVKGITYLLARLVPNYAATLRVLNEIKKRVPDFSPQAVLDFGSGLGSTVWAGNELWGGSINQYYCVDTSMDMHTIAEKIMCGGNQDNNEAYLDTVFYRHFLPVGSRSTFDLVVSAYTLLELPSKQERLKTIETLWKKSDQFLVLIENGTFEGYMALMEARDFVLNERREQQDKCSDNEEEGDLALRDQVRERLGQNYEVGHVFAPCQHDLACPTLAVPGKNIPCNFQQKYQPLMLSRKVPETQMERFSYLILRKGDRQSRDENWPRIVQSVMPRSKHVVCHLCCANGNLETATITRAKHGFDLYRCARNSTWGDLLPIAKQSQSEELSISETSIDETSSELVQHAQAELNEDINNWSQQSNATENEPHSNCDDESNTSSDGK